MSKSTSDDTVEIPSEFTKIVYDLINDILTTFPEYVDGLDVDLFNIKPQFKAGRSHSNHRR